MILLVNILICIYLPVLIKLYNFYYIQRACAQIRVCSHTFDNEMSRTSHTTVGGCLSVSGLFSDHIPHRPTMLGAVTRSSASLLAGKSLEKLGAEALKVFGVQTANREQILFFDIYSPRFGICHENREIHMIGRHRARVKVRCYVVTRNCEYFRLVYL